MEKSEGSKSEETGQEGLFIRDPVKRQVQKVDFKGLQSDLQLQKSEDSTLNEASKFGATHETQKLTQQEKEETVQKLQLKKHEENKSSRQECRELSGDKELKQKTDANIVVQQNDENSLVPEQDISQTNRPETHAINQECDVLSEDTLLVSKGNNTLQRRAEVAESMELKVRIQPTQQKANAADQESSATHESLRAKLVAYFTEQLKEKSLESFLVPFGDPSHSGEQEANDAEQEYDRTTENPRYFQESESCPEPEDSHLVCLHSRQSVPSPMRICHHRAHIMQRPRLSTVLEEPDLPLTPFEEEILVRRNRTLGARLLSMLPTGLRDYMRRIRECLFPSEMALHEHLQTICAKLFCSLLIAGIFIVAPYFLVVSESEDNSNGDSFTSPSNTSAVTFKPDTSESELEADTTTAMDDLDVNILNLDVDFDAEVSAALNDLNVSSTGT